MSIRSVRNNNPGNLERGIPWYGLMPPSQMSAEQAAETRFCVFINAQWGFRALATDLRTKWNHNFRTVRAILERYAPPEDNNTAAYITFVCGRLGVGPEDQLAFTLPQLAAFCRAIAMHEADGQWHYTDADLNNGVAMAMPS